MREDVQRLIIAIDHLHLMAYRGLRNRNVDFIFLHLTQRNRLKTTSWKLFDKITCSFVTRVTKKECANRVQKKEIYIYIYVYFDGHLENILRSIIRYAEFDRHLCLRASARILFSNL